MINEHIILIFLGILGVVIQSLWKMKILQELSRRANVHFNWYTTYVKSDAIAIIISFLTVLVYYLIHTEAGKYYPKADDYKRIFFFCSGLVGSSVVQFAADYLTNSAKTKLQKFIDVKTNIADVATGARPTDSLKEVIRKGEESTGKDVTSAPPAPKDVPVPDKDIKPV